MDIKETEWEGMDWISLAEGRGMNWISLAEGRDTLMKLLVP